MNHDQLLFSELRLAAVAKDSVPLTEEGVLKAMTVNEELLAMGYTLSPKDIITLAKSADTDGFAARIRAYIGDVKAKPMYPDFPAQVMEMDAAVFRFHQMLHYLSTYGVRELTGIRVTRGWLPEVPDNEKAQPDETLLAAKTLALIGTEERFLIPYRKILTKTERMTDKEQMLIAGCAKQLSAEEMAGVTVTFKQNLLLVFQAVFSDAALTADEKLSFLHTLCQHTGDVWKCMDYALTRAGFHFRTSQKRLIVRLLESYPLSDFRENLILSGKKRERTLLMLRFLDYNAYSRKADYAAAVAELRAGTLRSWESEIKEKVAQRAPDVLDAYAARPGMMIRHLTYLLRNGYRAEDIFTKLMPQAANLKTQTLVSLVSFFSRDNAASLDETKYQETVVLRPMLRHLLQMRLAANQTALRGKKVCIRMPDFDLDLSSLRVNDKSSEGGYIRSGLAYRIPENAKIIRFFIYWNDEECVDVDLHVSAAQRNGEELNIGWNAGYKSDEIVFSGDITHSDAAEYIDIDLEKAQKTLTAVSCNINLFSGPETFGEIGECFVGAMAVSETGADVKLYNPKNCFFTHVLTGKYRMMNYGFIDIPNRVIIFDGLLNDTRNYYEAMERNGAFSLREYLDILFRSQGAELTASPEDADVILIMGKPSGEKELSLIDADFFMEQAAPASADEAESL